MQSENGISNWNLKIQKNPKITKSREKNPKFFFHPKYGLWGLKSKGIARAFISSEKISRFLAILAFWYRGRYFFLTFWQFHYICYCWSSPSATNENCRIYSRAKAYLQAAIFVGGWRRASAVSDIGGGWNSKKVEKSSALYIKKPK